MYKAILFDLDGTLLHLNQNEFIYAYFKMILGEMLKIGSDLETLKKASKAGIHAMKYNDGSRLNRDAYWSAFGSIVNMDIAPFVEPTNEFYTTGYLALKDMTSVNLHARRAIDSARAKGIKLILATNPMFPRVAQLQRLEWAGFTENDFELITDYENFGFSKPNPKYYLEICERIGVSPSDCLMVGNDPEEDMICASNAGLDTFFVFDCAVEREGIIWNGTQGKFSELADMIEAL